MENHRILIVEDDEAIAGAVSRIIESWGFTPRCVRDFRDVLREFIYLGNIISTNCIPLTLCVSTYCHKHSSYEK